MDVKLFVDEKEIVLNEFVKKVFSGVLIGVVTSLRDIKENWEEIRVEVKN
ncbi:MAG: hypothetical protein ACLFU9_01995 [Candidatus Bathyarchaeia archaeon]